MVLFFIIVFSVANLYGTFALLGYKEYNFSDRDNGILFGIMGIVSAMVQGGLIKAMESKIKDRTLVLAGTVLMMLGLAGLPYGINFVGVALFLGILSIGAGILQPTVLSMVSKYAPEHEQGAILGLNQSFSALARVFGPLWGGFAFNFLGYQFPFITGAAFTFITFILSLIYIKSERMVETI